MLAQTWLTLEWRTSHTHLSAEAEIHRFAVAADTVQHAGLDATPTHGPVAELAGAPV